MPIGMPESLLLDEFASQVWAAFGRQPYLVGSALVDKAGWRDVDVRLILPDEEWDAAGFLPPSQGVTQRRDGKLVVALTLAFSVLGQKMTGLPIDFQIQRATEANRDYGGKPRSALGLVPLRWEQPRVRVRDDFGGVWISDDEKKTSWP